MTLDVLIVNARQVLTLAAQGPKIGDALGDLGMIEDGAVGLAQGRIAWVGPSSQGRKMADGSTIVIDATEQVVMPGFVDAHTHAVFAGARAQEFEQRIKGATYLEIMAAGGGIMSTVRATRECGLASLVAQSRRRLDGMLAHGTTTAEVKTGYGLDTTSELKCLAALRLLAASHPMDIVPTFLGAHAVPDEYEGDPEAYTDLVVNDMLPKVASNASRWSPPHPLFCDVFCEEGAFSLAQSRRILEAARKLGFKLKIHADEFTSLGGAALAAELGATSADHLARTPPSDMDRLAKAGVVAVLLPGTTFGLGERHYADARALIAAGVPVALGSDLNPGTCYCESMQFIVALACRYLRLSPAEAIAAATINAAHAIGLGHLTGSLEVGKRADLILLDLPDYRHLAYRFGTNLVKAVFKNGSLVSGAVP
ncbi:MAG: imidazolonepropionase [Chloroflexota bacterium]